MKFSQTVLMASRALEWLLSASDCQGTPVLNRSLEVDEKNKNFAITRLQSLLYKELKDYANKEAARQYGVISRISILLCAY